MSEFVIVGAGAIGAIVGVALIEAGHDVRFIESNRDHVAAVRAGGLRLSGHRNTGRRADRNAGRGGLAAAPGAAGGQIAAHARRAAAARRPPRAGRLRRLAAERAGGIPHRRPDRRAAHGRRVPDLRRTLHGAGRDRVRRTGRIPHRRDRRRDDAAHRGAARRLRGAAAGRGDRQHLRVSLVEDRARRDLFRDRDDGLRRDRSLRESRAIARCSAGWPARSSRWRRTGRCAWRSSTVSTRQCSGRARRRTRPRSPPPGRAEPLLEQPQEHAHRHLARSRDPQAQDRGRPADRPGDRDGARARHRDARDCPASSPSSTRSRAATGRSARRISLRSRMADTVVSNSSGKDDAIRKAGRHESEGVAARARRDGDRASVLARVGARRGRQPADRASARSIAGINFIDTCDYYSERRERARARPADRRTSSSATRSCSPPRSATRWGRGRTRSGYSRKHLFEAVDASLKRLGTDYIDLYQTHIWDPVDQSRGDDRGVRRAGARAGACSISASPTCRRGSSPRPTITRSCAACARFVSVQNHYNPIWREDERELMPLCRDEGIGLIPYSPMARGYLCGPQRRAGAAETARWRSDDYAHKIYGRPSDDAVAQVVGEIAQARGCEPGQVALAWTLSRPGVTAPIFGATRGRARGRGGEGAGAQARSRPRFAADRCRLCAAARAEMIDQQFGDRPGRLDQHRMAQARQDHEP